MIRFLKTSCIHCEYAGALFLSSLYSMFVICLSAEGFRGSLLVDLCCNAQCDLLWKKLN